jgi:trk system potassium uptake protein TrkA
VYLVSVAERADALLKAVGVPAVPVTRVMLAGGSKINRFVAIELEKRGVKPKLIEPDPRLARWISDELHNTVVLRGNPTDADLLRQENINEMQAFVAAGSDEEANVMSALLARRMGAKRVIATTNRADYIPVMKGIGIDVCISPRLIAVGSILHFIRQGRVVAARSLGEADNAEALEYEAHLTSEVVGRPLRELRLPRGALVAAIIRSDVAIIPTGDTVIEAGDHVIFVALRSAVAAIEKMLVRSTERF